MLNIEYIIDYGTIYTCHSERQSSRRIKCELYTMISSAAE